MRAGHECKMLRSCALARQRPSVLLSRMTRNGMALVCCLLLLTYDNTLTVFATGHDGGLSFAKVGLGMNPTPSPYPTATPASSSPRHCLSVPTEPSPRAPAVALPSTLASFAQVACRILVYENTLAPTPTPTPTPTLTLTLTLAAHPHRRCGCASA